MGYGHMRAAHALADQLAVPVRCADLAPLADERERRVWARVRRWYELVSRASQLPIIGVPFGLALSAITAIPDLYPFRDLSRPNLGVRYLARSARKGLGRGLVEHLRATGDVLLTTFYAPAVAADIAGCQRILCVVTDVDINRVWAPPDGAATRITYLVPGQRAARRLRAYGVPPDRIHFTGFPLPPELLGGRELRVLRSNLAGDEVRHFLGDVAVPAAGPAAPPLVTFAVGGAGAQAGLPRRFLPGFRGPIERGQLRLALVAGVRRHVAVAFEEAIAEAGLEGQLGSGVQILAEPDLPTYFQRLNQLLATTDVLWTKPSEMTFFAALGLPLLLAPPVGVHESYNLRWAREAGAGLKQRDARFVAERLIDWLEDGTLAGAAWSGFMRLPKFGTYRIADLVASQA
jgi:hypothetical protein